LISFHNDSLKLDCILDLMNVASVNYGLYSAI